MSAVVKHVPYCKPLATVLTAAIAISSLSACAEADPTRQYASVADASLNAGAPLILERVTVVDTRTGTLLENRSVAIADGTITGISEEAISGAGQRVDASGQYLVPGYIDMHAHMAADWTDPHINALLMLKHGTTGYRQMSGSEELLQQRKKRDIAPFDDAPALLAMPGAVMVGQIAKDPDGARAEVQSQHAAGADFIKAVDLDRASYLAAIDEASKQGLPFAGHLPATISVVEASKAGMRAIEHLGPNSSIVLSCSSEEAALREIVAQQPERGAPVLPNALAWALQPIINRVIKKVLTNPILLNDEETYLLMQRLVDSYDEGKCRALATTLAKTDMWQVPTLIRLRTMEIADAPEYRNNPMLQYVPDDRMKLWTSVTDDFIADVTPEQKETLKQFFALQMKLAGVFDSAGVKMLAGSDTGGGWVIPGLGLHQEFDLLQEAGIAPLRVLQMTTLNAAVFLGREASMGSVEIGKEANLVLLGANPMENVKNMHAINAVIRNGNYYSSADLQGLIDGN